MSRRSATDLTTALASDVETAWSKKLIAGMVTVRHHHGATWGGSGRRPKLPRPVRAPRRKSANPSGPFGAYAKCWYRYLKDTYPTYRSTDHGRPRDRFTQRTWQPEAVWARWPWANRAHSSGLRRDCPPTSPRRHGHVEPRYERRNKDMAVEHGMNGGMTWPWSTV